MASGTQGYEAAQGDIIDSLVDRFKKRKKNDKKGDTAPPNQPASISVSTPQQKMLVQGKTVQQLMPGSSALATTTGGDITKYSSEGGELIQAVVREQQTTNQLLQAQNQLLLRGSKGGAISKFDKQEAALEQTEDLSDTQGFEKAKTKGWLASLWDSIKGLLKPILDAALALAPAIAAAAGAIVLAIKAQAIAGALGNLAKGMRAAKGIRPVTVRDITNKPRGALAGAKSQLALPPGTVTPSSSALSTTKVKPTVSNVTDGTKALKPSTSQAFNPQAVKSQTRALEPIEVGRGNFKGSERKFEALKQTATRGTDAEATTARKILKSQGADVNVKPVTPAIPRAATNSADDIVGAAGDIAKTGKKSGLRFLIPGASAITAGLSVISGDYAGAIIDSADAAGDLAVASGATGAAATVGTALSAGAAVIGAGITASYVGEWTRGVGDWIRGDGNNMAMNMASGIVEGLSGTLETIGAPFRAIFEFINSGFNMEKSNDVMAEVDSNLRESFRQGLNMFDGLNIIPDEKGAFGTLGLYGDSAKRADAKMRGEGDVKNANGGSYFLDNPSNFGPFQGGEAGGEVVTFTPFGGRKLVNEMGKHMTDALQAPFKFAIGGIAAAIDKVVGMLGPIGQMMKSAIGPTLSKLVKASGLTGINLSVGGQGGLDLSSLFGGAFQGLGSMFQMPSFLRRNNGGGGGNMDAADIKADTAEEKAFIATVRELEGTSGEKGYDTWYGGRTDMKMTDMTMQQVHDEQTRRMAAGETTYGRHSSAAVGAGQFMTPLAQVRAMYKSQGRDFDPTKVKFTEELQNQLMLDLAKRKRGVDVSKPLTLAGMKKLGGEWASFTPQYGQTSRTASQSLGVYNENLGEARKVPPLTPPPSLLGSNFPNINNPGLSTTDQILMKTMPEVFAAMQQMKAANNASNNNRGGSDFGVAGFMQPLTDPNASPYTLLHLGRLGQN